MSMTQKLSKRGAFLAASLVLGAAFAAPSLSAQSVSTAPVGAVTKTINVGLNSVGITLVNPDLVVANASANTANSITLTGVTNVGALLTSGLPYYVEAISGPLEGERFDVDTAATITAANATVTLNAGSANNTFALAASNAVGSQFALRKHITLAQIQSFFTTPLVGNNNPALADQIQFLNASGTAFTSHNLRLNGTEWRLSGTATVSTNLAVPPGVGILFNKVNSAATMVVTGGVRVNDFSMPMPAGLSFRAPGYPISFSPASLGGTQANGWSGNNNPALADQLQLLNSAGTAFTSHNLRLNGTEWRLSGTATVVTTTPLFSFDSGFMISRINADTNYIIVSPVTL